ncbi:MAG TPA: response regulator [Bacteroidota bacterium]|nr:response regulator [Bacteroidota bacterium]
MEKKLRALIVEDSADDTELLVRELRRGGFEVEFERVETPESMATALERQVWDIIFCDYSMPHFRGTDALLLVKRSRLDLPLIFVSGTMGEDVAVEAMMAGAKDYIVKGNFKRLIPAVERELHEARLRAERRDIEDELHENEELVQTIFNMEPEGVMVVSPHGTLLQINPAGRITFELGEHERVVGRSIFRFMNRETRTSFETFLTRICSGERGILEFEISGTKGARRWLEANAVPLVTTKKEIIAMLAVTRDITDRRHAALLQNATYHIAEAENNSQSLEDLFRSVHKIIREVMSAQNFYIALYDETRDELSYPYFVDEVNTPPSPGTPRRGLTEYVLRTGKPLLCGENAREDLVRKGEATLSGSHSPLWLGVPLILDKKTIGVMVVQHYTNPDAYTDADRQVLEYVSLEVAKAIQRKQADEKLRESEEQFRLIMENAADLIAVLDLDGRWLYNSPSFQPIIGDLKTIHGTDAFQHIHPEDRIRIKTEFGETIRTGTGRWAEFRVLGESGTVWYIESRASVIRNESGLVERVVIVARDVTEKKKLEQQVLRTQRMESIGTLAGGIAHDLNNVLSPIMLAVDILKRKVGDKQNLAILDTLETSVNRGTSMVRQILTFARGVEGERLLIQPKHIVMEMSKIVTQTFPKSIQIRTVVPTDAWTFLGDPTQIHQVLLNLSVNARDAMPRGGVLKIEVANLNLDEHYARMHIEAKAGPYLLIQVSDSGSGIPREVLSKIFDPFFTTKEAGKGTGLGLSTSLAIIRSHGGFIDVYSELEKGTTFRVYIPAQAKTGGVESPEARPLLPSGKGETVLVIDDEASIRQITKETLETFGYNVLIASDGAEGVAVYAENKDAVNVVLTDMMMPHMDGMATIRALQRINPEVKIITATGLTDSFKEADIKAKGASSFLTKPYTAEKLLTALHAVLHEKSET